MAEDITETAQQAGSSTPASRGTNTASAGATYTASAGATYAASAGATYAGSAGHAQGEPKRQLSQTVAALIAAFKEAGRGMAAGAREGRENAERYSRR